MMKTRFFRRNQKEEPGGNATASGDMLTSSERSAMLTDSERSAGLGVDIDIDFSVTESGRTVAHLVNATGGGDNDDIDFSITSSGRTIEHIMQEQANAAAGSNTNTNNNNTNAPQPQQSNAANANAATPLVPAVTATISNPLTIPALPGAKSQARAIPQQRHGSEDSSGSAFLSGILNPNTNQLSHTPPSALGTSYENRHFGKRQRSGSVSGRLRSASDLEEKGLIDRQQKGILKDLIICGDEELQKALDQYEEGNPAVLENMIRSGALQNKAVPDLDLLGDLDLDFLTVNDIGPGDLHREGPGMYALPQQQQSASEHPGAPHNQRAASLPSVMQPPPSFPGKRHASEVIPTTRSRNASIISPDVIDDGIGELDFTGDFSDNGGGGYYGTAPAAANSSDHHHQHQFVSQQHASNKQRPFSPPMGGDDIRLRSNSLFSALINDPSARSASDHHHQELGRWMDRVPVNDHNTTAAHALVTTDDGAHHHAGNTVAATASRPIPIPDAKPQPSATSSKKKGRRKSDSAAMDRKMKAKMKQELAEQKRREKQEKREKREREKQEKREARLAAKEEKKKLKESKKKEAAAAMDDDDKPIHVPGSGRPRSMSDPHFKTTRDEFGLVEIERPEGWVGAYSPESRKVRIEKFLAKRHQRVWTKTVKYDVRKNFADSRLRVKGRFVKKEDEMLMRDLMSMT